MPLTIPNTPATPTAEQSSQSMPDQRDFDAIVAAETGTGVVAGCATTQTGAGAMSVDVAAGAIVSAGTEAAVTAGTVTITAADVTNPRFDLIVASSTGVKSAVAGTPAAAASTSQPGPVFPAIPAGSVLLASVYVAANAASILTADIQDKRAGALDSLMLTNATPLADVTLPAGYCALVDGLPLTIPVGVTVTIPASSTLTVREENGPQQWWTEAIDVPMISTTTFTAGTLRNTGKVSLGQAARTFNTFVTLETFMDIGTGQTWTQDNLCSAIGVNFAPTYAIVSGYLFSGGRGFQYAPTFINSPGGTPRTLLHHAQFYATALFRGDGAALTANSTAFLDGTAFDNVNAGTVVFGTYKSFDTGITPAAGATITDYKHYSVTAPTIGGAITNQYGLDIPKLTGATTINMGVRNASPTTFTPSAQQTLAAGTAVVADATIVQISTSGAVITTAAPTIANGQDGQILTIIYTGGGTSWQIQDQGTLANSNVRLVGTNMVLAPRDSITLMYNAAVGDWVEIARSNVT